MARPEHDVELYAYSDASEIVNLCVQTLTLSARCGRWDVVALDVRTLPMHPDTGLTVRRGALSLQFEVRGMNGNGKASFSIIWTFIHMVLNIMNEIIFTRLARKNIVLTNDRAALSRSAVFNFVSVIIHAVGNLHVLDPETSKVTDTFTPRGSDRVRPQGSHRGVVHVVERIVARGCGIEENLGCLVELLRQESSTWQFLA